MNLGELNWRKSAQHARERVRYVIRWHEPTNLHLRFAFTRRSCFTRQCYMRYTARLVFIPFDIIRYLSRWYWSCDMEFIWNYNFQDAKYKKGEKVEYFIKLSKSKKILVSAAILCALIYSVTPITYIYIYSRFIRNAVCRLASYMRKIVLCVFCKFNNYQNTHGHTQAEIFKTLSRNICARSNILFVFVPPFRRFWIQISFARLTFRNDTG